MARRLLIALKTLSMLCFLGIAPLPASPVARAEGPAKDPREPAEYRQIIGRAVREFDAGNFPEARGLFSRAHDLYPNARTHLGLGFTAFELRNYAISVDELEKALASNVKPLDAKLRRSAEDVLQRARENLAEVTLDISPRSGRVLVDGVPAEVSEGKPLVLEVGDHTLEVQASGYLSERRTLRLVGGEKLSVKVALSPLEAPAASPQPVVPAENAARADHDTGERRAWYKSPWLWVGVGVALAAGGVTTFILLRQNDKTEPGDPIVSANTPSGGVLKALRSK